MKKILFILILLFSIAIITCKDETTKTNSASGTYIWNAEAGVLLMIWTSSDFECNGPELYATDTMTQVVVTATAMTWENMEISWTRSGGTPGDIVGTWTAQDPAGNSYTCTFHSDGTVYVEADIVDCSSRDGRRANGTYTWDSDAGVIAFHVTSSNFSCSGLMVGNDTISGVTVTAMTMTFADKPGDVWYRTSGTAGVLTGTWTMQSMNNGEAQFIFNNDGTFVLETEEENCDQ